MQNEYPPAGTWDVIDRHGEPRYVVEHDGKGGWWGVCQPDRPEDCYVLAASKDLLAALKAMVACADAEHKGLKMADEAIRKAENNE